ncbi:hypothetical protein [Aerococcus christensenii]|uniref:hypothetical protein n=1 Tax=Aerococcus christensenii TaxID=87541 RepID=UPI0023A91B66|nr:hypothetical protein [Aerococcus christensenii]WEB70261.1 hypothetical protein PUW42_04125 [Aerococcus christensenii]
MELTLAIEDLSHLEIKDSQGIVYSIIKKSVIEDWKNELKKVVSKDRFINQSRVRKEYHWGQDKINRFIEEGKLTENREISDKAVYYDRKEIEKILEGN